MMGRVLRVVWLLALAALVPADTPARAQAPAPAPAPAPAAVTDPVLRIETGGHTAIMLGLAPSADGSRLATASYDRTVRIWSLPKLELERTIYLPAGPELEGSATSAAFSPDGNSLATSGWTGTWGSSAGPWCVYVIDVPSADIARAVCDLPKRAHHMVYSHDGAFLLVTLRDAGGLRVYRTADYTMVAEDRDYGTVATWVDVDAAGRAVTASLDGKVRLYDKAFKRIATTTMPEDRKPITVSFAPDGARIAVAYAEPEGSDPLWSPAVDVLNAADLTVAFRPDTRGMDNGTLWRLAWSADGRFLYAGGTWQKAGRYTIRRWADAGRGRPADIPASANRIVRIRTLPAGGVAYVSEVPYLGVIGANDRVIAERKLTTADATDLNDKLLVSRDGLHVQFAFEPFGARPAHFSLTRRLLEDGEAPPDAQLAGPIMDAPNLDVRDWAWSYRPTLNGQPLAMRPHDQALTMAITPDRQGVVLGTSWEIIRYDATGKALWTTPVYMNTRGLAITADARLLVAAVGDGTVRWYAMDTGREVLAFFAHADGQRWVAWTPSGYYMASVGGDSLIGWQVNRGRDKAADFFSVGRFSDKYYRPDIVERSLATLDEATAIREANAEGGRTEQRRSVTQLLPPVIEIIDPPRAIKSAELTLKVRVRAPSGEPIEEIQVRNEGHAIGHYDAPILDNHGEGTADLQLIVPQRDSELLVFARNRFAVSEPARIKLVWAGDQVAAAVDQRRVFLLAIGVSDYQQQSLKLGFAAKDAGDFAAAVERQQGKNKAFTHVETRVLTNREATLPAIRDGLAWLGSNAGRDDLGVIFLAGHGVDDRDGTYYYLPHEAELPRLSETALPYRDLLAGLKAVAGHAVLFVDTCHAGAVTGKPGKASMDVIGLVSRLSQPSNGVIVYASSTGDQYSIEASIWRNGAFTKAVVEGLDGAAEYRKRSYITTSMLETYVKERVKDLTASRQTPTVNMPIAVPDLLLARIGGG